VSEPATLTKVPFLDLRVLHADLKEDVLAAMSELIDRAEFGSAVAVREFEDAFAAFCGVSWCVALSSGLDGIRFLLEAVGVERGDEVIVPAMTFVATYEAISQVGATPVPVDVTSGDYCIDWAEVEAAITPRTRVLLPVHLYGQLADMTALPGLSRWSRTPAKRTVPPARARGQDTRQPAQPSASTRARTWARWATRARS
jgi:dTDP-4-amino-4,6-dideoxygalactose transaminase